MRARAALLSVALASLAAVGGCARGDPGAAGARLAEEARRVTVTVGVPEGSPTVYLTGNLDTLGPWNPSALAMQGEGRQRTADVAVPRGDTFEYKVTLGSWDREGLGPSGTVMPNFRLVVRSDTAVIPDIVDFKKDPREYIADWRAPGG